jgi:hypothetical protein
MMFLMGTRHAGASIVRTIEFGIIFVLEKFAPLAGQEAVEAASANKAQVLVVGFEQTALARSFTKHISLLNCSIEEFTNSRKS